MRVLIAVVVEIQYGEKETAAIVFYYTKFSTSSQNKKFTDNPKSRECTSACERERGWGIARSVQNADTNISSADNRTARDDEWGGGRLLESNIARASEFLIWPPDNYQGVKSKIHRPFAWSNRPPGVDINHFENHWSNCMKKKIMVTCTSYSLWNILTMCHGE